MTERYFNYTPRVVNVFKLFGFHSETPGLQFTLLFHQILGFYHLWLSIDNKY